MASTGRSLLLVLCQTAGRVTTKLSKISVWNSIACVAASVLASDSEYRFMDRMYAQRMGNSGVNPLGVATAYSQNMYGPKATGAYVAKSRLKDGSNASVRSKSMRSGMSRRSQLSKNKKPSKRFNEDLDAMSIRSRPSQHPGKTVVRDQKQPIEKPTINEKKKQVIDKIEKMGDNLEKLRSTLNIDKNENNELEGAEDELARDGENQIEENKDEALNEEDKQKDEQELHDEIDSLYYGSYSESRRSGKSRKSNITSATYISKLEKELQEERKARERLAKELEEIKKISSEISSHLGLKQTMDNKH